jgi:hypothetical protein
MANLKLTRADAGAKLLKKLIEKADVAPKDGTVKAREATKAGQTKDDGNILLNALRAEVAAAKNLGDMTVGGVKKAIDKALKDLKSLDKDGSGSLDDTEIKRAKNKSTKALIDFAQKYGASKESSFDFGSVQTPTPNKGTFTPVGTPTQVADRVTRFYNSGANDNYWPTGRSRYVISKQEGAAIVKAIGSWKPALAKAVLQEISGRVLAGGLNSIYIEPDGQAAFKALAKKVGAPGLGFNGPKDAPKFPGY